MCFFINRLAGRSARGAGLVFSGRYFVFQSSGWGVWLVCWSLLERRSLPLPYFWRFGSCAVFQSSCSLAGRPASCSRSCSSGVVAWGLLLFFDYRSAGRRLVVSWSSGRSSCRRLVVSCAPLSWSVTFSLVREKVTKERARRSRISVTIFECRDPFRGSSTLSYW